MNLTQRRTQSGFRFLMSGFVAIFVVCICSVANASDPLTSWNDGPAKSAIVEFVQAVTNEKGKDYVEPADRKSHVGTLDKALDQAAGEGWIIVDMKKDWKTVFPAKSQ